MNRFIVNLLLICFSFSPNTSIASNSDIGKTSYVLTTINGRAFFEQSGVRSARPPCATATRWAIDITTTQGQAMLANLLTVNAGGKSVYISGTGDCSAWADSETVAGIQTAN